MITIAPVRRLSLYDKLGFALSEINKAIESTDGGRECSGPTWSAMHDCRRSILEAMQMIRIGRNGNAGAVDVG